MDRICRFPTGPALLVSMLLLIWSLPAAAVEGEERITSFHSRIAIGSGGSLEVRETITVRAAGQKIRRGIFRDFPTRYHGRFGSRVTVPFSVRRVLRDGKPEPWHTERRGRDTRVYMGRKNIVLDPGEYVYTLEYTTHHQLGFFDEFDELYWNVTGSGWEFPIDRAAAEIRLPPSAPLVKSSAYTGPPGSEGGDFTVKQTGGGEVIFSTDRKLAPGEGLTVAVAWPKGFVDEPSPGEDRRRFARDNRSLVAGLAGLLVLLLYQGGAWLKVGRDPPGGVIVPLFEPPEGYSPAAARYVLGMGYSDRAFAAALVSMAVKGAITIEGEKGDYALSRTGTEETALTKGEAGIARALFSGGDHIALNSRNHRSIAKAVKALKKSLREDFEKLHFRKNGRYVLPGVLIAGLAAAAAVLGAEEIPVALFITFWLSFWTIGCILFLAQISRSWKGAYHSRGAIGIVRALAAMFLTVFSLPFLGGEFFGLWIFSETTSPSTAALLLLLIFSNFLFARILKAPTLYGRRAMDRIEGFRRYLAAAEGARLRRMHSPEKTPELYERYLPYAMALDVESAWSRSFEGILAASGKDRAYRPTWYRGGDWSAAGSAALAAGLGSSLASAVTSSSSPPGSASGSGGGGSSGGGGGGGGGGGW